MLPPPVACDGVLPPELHPTCRAYIGGPPAMADLPVTVKGMLSAVYRSAPGRFAANPLRPNANVRSTFRR